MKNETKHTPGPWTAEKIPGGCSYGVNPAKGGSPKIDERPGTGQERICACWGQTHDAKANAAYAAANAAYAAANAAYAADAAEKILDKCEDFIQAKIKTLEVVK